MKENEKVAENTEDMKNTEQKEARPKSHKKLRLIAGIAAAALTYIDCSENFLTKLDVSHQLHL